MATAERAGVASAARFRGTGAGAFERAVGAFFDARRAGQLPSGLSEHSGAVLSLSAAASIAFLAQTAGDNDAEEFVAAPESGFNSGRMCGRKFSANSARPFGEGSQRSSGYSALHGKDLL